MRPELKMAACGLECNVCNLYRAAFDPAAEALLHRREAEQHEL